MANLIEHTENHQAGVPGGKKEAAPVSFRPSSQDFCVTNLLFLVSVVIIRKYKQLTGSQKENKNQVTGKKELESPNCCHSLTWIIREPNRKRKGEESRHCGLHIHPELSAWEGGMSIKVICIVPWFGTKPWQSGSVWSKNVALGVASCKSLPAGKWHQQLMKKFEPKDPL